MGSPVLIFFSTAWSIFCQDTLENTEIILYPLRDVYEKSLQALKWDNNEDDNINLVIEVCEGVFGVSTSMGGVSTSMGGVSTSMGGVSTSMGGVSTSMGGVSTSMGGVSTSMGGVSTSMGTIHRLKLLSINNTLRKTH